MADEDALLDAQLGEEVLQIVRHRFVGQHRAVRAVAVVTGIYSQHLTGQRTVRTLGMMGKEPRERKQEHFYVFVCLFLFIFWLQLGEVTTQTKAVLCVRGDEFPQKCLLQQCRRLSDDWQNTG